MKEGPNTANTERALMLAANSDVAADVVFGRNVSITAEQLTVRSGVIVGDNVTIVGQDVYLDAGAQIQDEVSISARRFVLGFRSRLERRCIVSGMGTPSAGEIVIGENSLLASDCRVFIPILKVGDFVKIHNHTLINGQKACVIGHNSWIGQNNILNGEDALIIGNNVGLGIYTSVWTHAYFGDLLEGCTVFKVAPTIIEDDVWVVGAYNVIAPGIRIGSKTMVLTGSFVNGDVPPNHCVAGSPARDITDRITPYRTISIDEKFHMMRGFVEEFLQERYPGVWIKGDRSYEVQGDSRKFEILFLDVADEGQTGEDTEKLIITKKNLVRRDYKFVTLFDLSRREYTKCRTESEIELLRFLLPYRARFVPAGQPRVELG